ncbi:hypothetical protein RGU70_08055 [Herbaspirillum sp. RTI4]|uniref:hypothetical protein n=1 Tax=Herbaspirillum sp. RTI4 TaxID=3048640 RepID=UPI002AB373EE|nr:hypothetical protein [Herbaspirillum sp. RTI4]MDY7578272.1 hypothetical protein [Herbaspirillum sp. RTI4]MEA9981235.1 hypothetical protein [Herbaspirillum sp. RTI4]
MNKSVPSPAKYDSASEITLDDANEMSFPASDPISASNITRIDKAPEMAPAAEDHPISNQVDHIEAQE